MNNELHDDCFSVAESRVRNKERKTKKREEFSVWKLLRSYEERKLNFMEKVSINCIFTKLNLVGIFWENIIQGILCMKFLIQVANMKSIEKVMDVNLDNWNFVYFELLKSIRDKIWSKFQFNPEFLRIQNVGWKLGENLRKKTLKLEF